MTIRNRRNLNACATAGRPFSWTTALGRSKPGIHTALALVNHPVRAQLLRQLSEDFAQQLAVVPLKPTAHRFVIGIALRQQMPSHRSESRATPPRPRI